MSFLPRTLWLGLIDKYGINSSRNPEAFDITELPSVRE
jgi:hypothetical protein